MRGVARVSQLLVPCSAAESCLSLRAAVSRQLPQRTPKNSFHTTSPAFPRTHGGYFWPAKTNSFPGSNPVPGYYGLKTLDMGSEPLEIPIPPRVARPPNPILTARLTLTAAMPDHLRLMAHFARHAAAHLNLRTAPGTWVRPNLRRFRILKSPFVHAKSKEIFERRVHAMTVDVHNGHWETQRAWVDYVVAATPPGIKVTLEEWTRENVGYGKRLEAAANDELGRRSPEGGGVKKIAWPPRTVSDVVLQKAQVLLKQLGGPPLAAGGEKKAANDAKAGKAEKSGKGAKTEKR